MSALDALARRRSQDLPALTARLRRGYLLQQSVQAVDSPRLMIGGRWVLNLASCNYLALGQHPLLALSALSAAKRWGMSLGMSRQLAIDPITACVERQVARLTGQEAALLFPSTTHVALDLLPLLAGPGGALFVDEWAYPISLQGVALAVDKGAEMQRFAHNNAQALAYALEGRKRAREKVIVCDGVYSAGGEPAALDQFSRLAQEYDALIYLDDAHGIGVLGRNPSLLAPYGSGGSGTPAFFGVRTGRIVHAGSLSKAFGVPLAFVAGPTGFIDYLRSTAGSYMHSSPSAIPIMAAALAALSIHATQGDSIRGRLAKVVRQFRRGMVQVGLELSSQHLFPIQTLSFRSPQAAENAALALRRQGIWTVLQLHPPDHPIGGAIRFILNPCLDQADNDLIVRGIYKINEA